MEISLGNSVFSDTANARIIGMPKCKTWHHLPRHVEHQAIDLVFTQDRRALRGNLLSTDDGIRPLSECHLFESVTRSEETEFDLQTTRDCVSQRFAREDRAKIPPCN
jgi:hypothetical protein